MAIGAMKIEDITREMLELSCDTQFYLATRLAANLGYVLTPEPSFDDPPAGYTKLPDGMICKCAKVRRDVDGFYWCCLPKK
jgi:hypothetical protein